MLQLIINGEDFLTARHVAAFIKKHVETATRDFNFDRISARSTPMTKLIDLCLTPPMMALSRCIIVEDFEAYKTGEKNSPQWERFGETLKKITPETHVLFVSRAIDKRTRFYKTFATLGEIIEFKRPYENRLPVFVVDEAKSRGLGISIEAATRLAELSGPELGSLVNEIEKLALAIMPRKKIDLDDVSSFGARGGGANVFALGEKLIRKDRAGGLFLYRQLTELGEVAVKILGLLVAHVRKLILLSEARQQKPPLSEMQLAAVVGAPVFFLKDYLDQVGKTSVAQLKHTYDKLMLLTVNTRLSGRNEKNQMEDFFVSS